MDPWENSLSVKKLARLKKSWAEIFKQHILPRMPITQIAKYFNKKMGRPTKELVSTCGACVLQQIFDLTDDETVDQMAFNQQWHYALDVLDQDDQLLSLKTLWNMRHILTTDSLAKKVSMMQQIDLRKSIRLIPVSSASIRSIFIPTWRVWVACDF